MSDDNVIPFGKYKQVEDQDPDWAKAKEARLRELKRKQDRAAARKALSERIRTLKPSIDERERIAKRLGALYSELKKAGLRGVIGPIFEEAGIGHREDSSKRLRRYIIPAGESGNPKMLSASLPEYERLAAGIAQALQYDADTVVLDVLRDFSSDVLGSAPSNETDYGTVAIMLNEMCNAISRRYRLKDAFSKAASWGIGADSEGRWKPEIVIARFHPANLPMEKWIAREDGIPELKLMLPSVELHCARYHIPVRATLRGASPEVGDQRLTDPDYWDANISTYGEANGIFLSADHTVYIGFAPDPSMSAIGVLWESVDLVPLIGDKPPFEIQSVSRGWYTFRSTLSDGTDEVNAFKIDEPRIAEQGVVATLLAFQDAIEGYSAFRIRGITPLSLAEMFAKADSLSMDTNFDFEKTVIWGGDWEDMVLEDRVVQSHSPSRTVAAAIERNLAFAPLPERLDTLVEEKVVTFKSALDSYVNGFTEPFLKAADPLLDQWRSESNEAEPSK